MDLYHVEIGFPKWFKPNLGRIQPRYGNHSRFEAQVDRYGHIDLPKIIDTTKCQIVEIGVENGVVHKILFRMQFDEIRDLCLVIDRTGFVRTCWVNLRSDTHRTLDRTKYRKP